MYEKVIFLPLKQVLYRLFIIESPNFLDHGFCGLTGLTWYLQFFFYGMGFSRIGAFKFSDWTLQIALIIVFSSLCGLYILTIGEVQMP